LTIHIDITHSPCGLYGECTSVPPYQCDCVATTGGDFCCSITNDTSGEICGGHGYCVSGGVCECYPGYSGD